MTRRRGGGHGVALIGAVAAVGAALAWADLLYAQPAGQSIAAILEAKAWRTPVQRKLSSQLLDAVGVQPSDGGTHWQALAPQVKDEPTLSVSDKDEQPPTLALEDTVVMVDIRADVTDAVLLARIRALCQARRSP